MLSRKAALDSAMDTILNMSSNQEKSETYAQRDHEDGYEPEVTGGSGGIRNSFTSSYVKNLS